MTKSLLQAWDAISRVVTDIAEVGDLDAVRLELQRSIITRLVGADDASVDELDYHHNTASWITIRPMPGYNQRQAVFSRHFREHPFVQAYETAEGPMVTRLSDMLPFRFFERRPIYEEMYRPIGSRYQLLMGLTQGVRCYTITLHRSDRDFSDRDRKVLQLAAPLLTPLFKAAVQREQLRFALSATSAGRGIIHLQPNNSILWANGRARQSLAENFAWEQKHELPPPILSWMRNPTHALQHASRGAHSEPGRVTIRLVREGSERILLIEQAPAAPTPHALQSLGLTPRQSEVLFWISRGKSNSEIGIILGTSVHTINRHAEGIYARLNVQSRSAAAVHAMQVLGV